MGRFGPGLAWLFWGGIAWAQLLHLTAATPLYAVVLLSGGAGGTWLAARLLTRLFLPYDGEERRWRRLARTASSLEVDAFGGHRPPEGVLVRGRARAHIRPRGDGFVVSLRLIGAATDAPPIRFDGAVPTPGPLVGDARLEGALGFEGPTDALLAALTEAVRDRLAADVVGRDVRIEPGLAVFAAPHALRRPKRLLARIDALRALLEALEAALSRPLEQALTSPDPSPAVTAARLRTYFEGAHTGAAEAHALALADAPPPVRWAVSEGLAISSDPQRRARALRRLREALEAGDLAARRHALAVLARRFPARLARAEAARQALEAEAPPLPEAVALLPEATLAAPRLLERLDEAPADAILALLPVLEARRAEPTLSYLAHHAESVVALEALDVLGRIGTLQSVPPLLALSRTLRTPARRGAALLVARRLQARWGHPARGALSWAGAAPGGHLSEPAA